MKVVNYTDLRLNLKKFLDAVVDDMQELVIKRKDDKDLVLISLDEYNSLMETQYLLKGANGQRILKSLDSIKKGKVLKNDLIVDED